MLGFKSKFANRCKLSKKWSFWKEFNNLTNLKIFHSETFFVWKFFQTNPFLIEGNNFESFFMHLKKKFSFAVTNVVSSYCL